MASANAARAEQFTITGGTGFGETRAGTLTLTGTRFDFTVRTETGEVFNPDHIFCPSPCDPTAVDFTASLSGYLGSGWADVGDNSYGLVDFYGVLNFMGGPTTIDDDAPFMTEVQGPFEFTALLNGFSGGVQRFSHTLTGQGHALVRVFTTFSGDTAITTELAFAAEQQAPVPEPGTWLLIATGAAGLAARRRRHLAQHSAGDSL